MAEFKDLLAQQSEQLLMCHEAVVSRLQLEILALRNGTPQSSALPGVAAPAAEAPSGSEEEPISPISPCVMPIPVVPGIVHQDSDSDDPSDESSGSDEPPPPTPPRKNASEKDLPKGGMPSLLASDTARRHSLAAPDKLAIPGTSTPRQRSSSVVSLGAAATMALRRSVFFVEENKLELHELWNEMLTLAAENENGHGENKLKRNATRDLNRSKSLEFRLYVAGQVGIEKMLQKFVIHPSTALRGAWMLLGFSLILYDLVMVPLSAFEVKTESFSGIIWALALTYWCIDLVMSFFVGYYTDGSLEMRPKKTMMNYLKTWFIPDAILVSFDLVEVLIKGFDIDASVGRAARTARTTRYLRTMRMLRVFKMGRFLEFTKFLNLQGGSEYVTLSFGILKQLCGILLINHFIATLFYTIGKEPGGWVHVYDIDVSEWRYTYLTALHWSLTQFTPASMNVQPSGLNERAFAVAVLLFALITFSSFVSSITNLMTHIRSLKSAEIKQFSKLESFLQEHKISLVLSLRVRRYLEHNLNKQRRTPQEADIELFARLSEPLKIELHHEVYGPLIIKHPFFAYFQSVNLYAMKSFCHTGIQSIQLCKDDTVFKDGEVAKHMYFVQQGCLDYTPGNRDMKTEVIESGDWVCEMALWCSWTHFGTLRSKTECSALVCVVVEQFHEAVLGSRGGQLEAARYGNEVVDSLNAKDKAERSDLDGEQFSASEIISRLFQVRRSGLAKTSLMLMSVAPDAS
eukprot:TRINITY_DN41470_c0_g1_i1.p1 TRINITY_DN41470_c0_g1~~TRINITY_DN41470_c0_g1_i1.p1  ORF type:complete len:744 (+),score=160.80 TRINITY_DN41470_c0_g1_i1:59-2290(+)